MHKDYATMVDFEQNDTPETPPETGVRGIGKLRLLGARSISGTPPTLHVTEQAKIQHRAGLQDEAEIEW